MALGNVMQSAGSLCRAESEFNLLKTENQKRLRVDSTLARAKADEQNARAAETDDSNKSAIEASYEAKSAEHAKQAALYAFISSIVSAVGGFASSAASGNYTGALLGLVGSGFAVLGAYMAYRGAGEEAELAETKAGTLSKAAKKDQDQTKQLDANPTL
jgi:hypothetical protein